MKLKMQNETLTCQTKGFGTRVIFKICGPFVTQNQLNQHSKQLRIFRRIQLFVISYTLKEDYIHSQQLIDQQRISIEQLNAWKDARYCRNYHYTFLQSFYSTYYATITICCKKQLLEIFQFCSFLFISTVYGTTILTKLL